MLTATNSLQSIGIGIIRTEKIRLNQHSLERSNWLYYAG